MSRHATAEPTTNIAEDHDDAPQAAGLIKTADHREATSIAKEQSLFNKPLKQSMLDRTCRSDQAYKIYVT